LAIKVVKLLVKLLMKLYQTGSNHYQYREGGGSAAAVVAVDDAGDEEEGAPQEERDLDALLQELDVATGTLVHLADVVHGAQAPERRPGDEQVQAVPRQAVLVTSLHLYT
jgi:hypothetical protein